MENRRKRIISVVFMPTLACNCRCEYCFQRTSGEMMSDEILCRFLDGLCEYAQAENILGVKMFWQGGDVLTMPPQRASEILSIIEERIADSGIIVNNYLQTNLLGYHRGWKPIFERGFKDKISSSLDYPNLYRKTARIGVDAYFDQWIAKKKEVEDDGFNVAVIALPNAQTLERGAEQFYAFYRQTAGVRSLQVNFPFPGLASDFPRALSLDKYREFLRELHGVWRRDDKAIDLKPFTTIEKKLQTPSASTFCIWSYCCADDILAVAPGGEIAQCDCWILCLEDFKYGTLRQQGLKELMASRNRRIFYERTERLALQSDCGECRYWALCHGGCPIRAYRFTGEFFAKDHFCEVYKDLFDLFFPSGYDDGSRGGPDDEKAQSNR